MAAILNYLFGADFRCCDALGNALVGGHLEVYYEGESGTLEKCITYSDFDGHTNPFKISIPSNGMPIIIVDASRAYRVHCYNLLGMQIWSRYNVRPECSTSIVGDDIIDAKTVRDDVLNVTELSIKDNSIGREQLKGARDLIVDSQYLKMERQEGSSEVILTLAAEVPSNDGTYVLKMVNGTMKWVAE